MELAYPSIVIASLIFILVPLIGLPVAWMRWRRGKGEQTGSGWRERLILKGLVAATIAVSAPAFMMIAVAFNRNMLVEKAQAQLIGRFSLVCLPAALFAIFAAVVEVGRGRIPIFVVGLVAGVHWSMGFAALFGAP